jgi:hypothetical protein
MQVRHRLIGVPPPGQRHRLTPGNVVALAHHRPVQERTRAGQPAAVVDRHEEPAPDLPRERHDPIVGSDDDRREVGSDIDPAVACAVRAVGGLEATDDRPRHGPRPRHGGVDGLDRRPHSAERHEGDAEHATPHARDDMGWAAVPP